MLQPVNLIRAVMLATNLHLLEGSHQTYCVCRRDAMTRQLRDWPNRASGQRQGLCVFTVRAFPKHNPTFNFAGTSNSNITHLDMF